MQYSKNYKFNLPDKGDYATIPEHFNPNFQKIDDVIYGLGSGVHIGPNPPKDREDMWVDTDDNSPTLPVATKTSDGLMASEDKAKLDTLVDPTLTKDGFAADSGVVGRKIQNLVPKSDLEWHKLTVNVTSQAGPNFKSTMIPELAKAKEVIILISDAYPWYTLMPKFLGKNFLYENHTEIISTSLTYTYNAMFDVMLTDGGIGLRHWFIGASATTPFVHTIYYR